MVSYTTLALALGVFIAVSGPKDIHRYARMGGRLVGRTVGFVKTTKGEFDGVMGKSQMSEVHKELKEAMAQLNAIRYEIRSGLSFTGSPPVREVYPEESATASHSTTTSTVTSQTVTTTTTATASSQDASSHQGFDVAAQNLASATASQVTATTSASSDHHGLLSSQMLRKQFYDQEMQQNSKPGVDFVKMEVNHSIAARRPQSAPDKEVDVIPVSAAIAKLIPERTGPTTGSDIMLEAIEEMKVASHALVVMKQYAVNLSQQQPEQDQHQQDQQQQ
ncbi:uncharacterized protein LOC9646278 isoform X3 [Selaginella moellendorffii]|uniref:uncharacterized protein LOC9646278 isoform X3 n=1 Tax=Selaginella moellendorffii TaxID=88036 RepID=UPI000D1CEB86|nr:uncharacterized protein LOC9646278 isoform X3 [Selaginella moellendorffii]|eukprot:XP_024530748.1 uncharacterized protein LOC9646278 isoform X3 [Selaginella moellendorffii]